MISHVTLVKIVIKSVMSNCNSCIPFAGRGVLVEQ